MGLDRRIWQRAIDKADKREANGIERLESRDRACESDIKEEGKRERERAISCFNCLIQVRMRQDQSASAALQTDVSLFCKNQHWTRRDLYTI